jgi:L-ascorbate 6-phosphate lactonase
VLLTHDHVHHTNPETLLPLASASPQARFVCPSTSRDTFVEAGLDRDRITVPEVSESLKVVGATATAVPSAHTELERDPDRGYPYLGT